MDQAVIILSLIYIYYHIGGLATTNILRLTKGNNLPVNSSKCICDSCGSKIPAYLQFPVISYILCRGKCKNCGSPIPVYPLILEITVILGMNLLTAIFQFSLGGVVASFTFYEISRFITILVKGKRAEHFTRQYFIAVLSMIPFFLITAFVSLIYSAL